MNKCVSEREGKKRVNPQYPLQLARLDPVKNTDNTVFPFPFDALQVLVRAVLFSVDSSQTVCELRTARGR